jgi:hypothetical protein
MWRYTAITALTVQDFDGRTIARPLSRCPIRSRRLSHRIGGVSHPIVGVWPDRLPQPAAFVADHTLCSRARRVLLLAREDPRLATYVLCRLSTQ